MTAKPALYSPQQKEPLPPGVHCSLTFSSLWRGHLRADWPFTALPHSVQLRSAAWLQGPADPLGVQTLQGRHDVTVHKRAPQR